MDYEAIRGGLEVAIPFNVHLGLQVVEVGPGRAVVRLPDDARLRNPIGSQHAGALFSAGELASDGAFAGAFVDIITELEPMTDTADISFQGIARGPIDATAVIPGGVDMLRATLDSEGRVAFNVDVTMTNAAGTTVALMTVKWDVTRKAAA
jgi:Domain of unknown function (DUF4442)